MAWTRDTSNCMRQRLKEKKIPYFSTLNKAIDDNPEIRKIEKNTMNITIKNVIRG